MSLVVWMPVQAQDNTIEGLAFINNVVIERDRGFVVLRITGELADPCTQLGEITQEVVGDVISVTVPTVRDADVMCAAVVEPFEAVYRLRAGGLGAGDYTLIVNDFATIITLTSADMSADMSDTDRPACYRPFDGTRTVIDLDAGVCFIAPINARVSQPYVNTVRVRQAIDGRTVGLIISATPALSGNLSDVIARQINAYNDLSFAFRRDTIGGLEATVSDNMPVPNGGRRAYVLANGYLYRLTVASDGGDVDDDVEALWQLVTQSMSFIGADAIQAVTLDGYGAQFALPMRWQVESAAGGYVLVNGEGEAMAGFVRFNVAGDETPLATIAATYGATMTTTPEFSRIGSGVGLQAYRLDIEDTCRTLVLLRDDGTAHVILLSPVACDLNRNVTNVGIQMMLDTLRYD